MAVAFGRMNAGLNGGTTSVAVTMPTVVNAGEMLVVWSTGRQPNVPVAPTGWTLAATAIGGTGMEVADSGTVRSCLYIKIADGTEASTNVTFSAGTSGTSILCRAAAYTKDPAKAWAWEGAGGVDNTPDTTFTVTFPGPFSFSGGEYIIAGICTNSDANTPTTGRDILINSSSKGPNVRYSAGSTTGNDSYMICYDASNTVTAISGATITTSATTSAATLTSPTGASAIVILREADILTRKVYIIS